MAAGRNKLEDKSRDRRYFIITPQLVWALSRDTYDYTLWNVVKMVAGDYGECILSTDDLTALAMMSTGKCSQCRKYLLRIGLLEGELRQDPGYPQPVWHLRIPDLWPRNLAWRQELGDKLKDRIRFKRAQKESLQQVKKVPHQVKKVPHQVKERRTIKENQKMYLEIAHKSFCQASRAPTPGNPAAWEPPPLGKITLHLSYG